MTLTSEGHALVERAVDDLLVQEESLLAALAPEQRDTLAALLRTLLTSLPAPAIAHHHRNLAEMSEGGSMVETDSVDGI